MLYSSQGILGELALRRIVDIVVLEEIVHLPPEYNVILIILSLKISR